MIVEKSKLKKALARVNAFTVKDNLNSTNPPRVLFKAKDGKVEITSSNKTDFGRFTFDIEDKSEIGFTIELKDLMRATTMRGDPDIVFDEDCVQFSNGDTQMTFGARDASTYPLDSYELGDDKRIALPTDTLKKLVGKVAYCRNEKDQREFITGVHLMFDGKKLTAEATDAGRGMRNVLELDEDKGFSFNGIINAKTIGMIDSLEDGQEVQIGMDERAILIDNSEMSVYVVLINAKYPDMDRFLNGIKNNASFTLDRDAVVESLGLFSMSENKSLHLEGEGDKLVISQDDGVSKIKDTIPLEDFKGSQFSFLIDIDMFRELFQNIKEGSTKLHFVFNASEAPIQVYDEEKLLGAICPLRLQ